jgi:hypothetical protein
MNGLRDLAALAAIIVVVTAAPCFAQSTDGAPVAERSVKAAYLYKFASYVDWPENVSNARLLPLQIGVLGAQDLSDELATITNGRQIGGRPIQVRQLRSSDPVDDLHILFIGRDEASRLERLLTPARSRPILTVTDSDDALTAGSIINFVVFDETVRFEISLLEAEQSGLRLDARLLAVAKAVRRKAD